MSTPCRSLALPVLLACLLPTADAQTRINARLARPIGGDVQAQRLSPDGAWAVYLADQDVDEVLDLYAVSLLSDPPAVRRLNDFVAFADVERDFLVTPDSSRAVWRADSRVDGQEELFGAPLAGGPAVRLSGDLEPSERVLEGLRFDATGSLVLFRTAPQGTLDVRLHVAPVDGSAPALRIDGGFRVRAFDVTDPGRVVFSTYATPPQLYSVPLSGGAPLRLDDTPIGGAPGYDFQVRPGSDDVLFRRASQGLSHVSALGGPSTPLTDDTYEAREIRVTPDASTLVFQGTRNLLSGLWSVPLDGAPLVTVLDDVGAPQSDFVVTADSRHVVYHAVVGAGRGLASVPIDGSASPTVLEPQSGVTPFPFQVSPNGKRVAYVIPGIGLYGGLVDGSLSSVELENADGGDWVGFRFTQDSRTIVFSRPSGAVLSDGGLRAVGLANAGNPTSLGGPLQRGGRIEAEDFAVDPLGRWVVYAGEIEHREAAELYRSPLGGTPSTERLSPPFVVAPADGRVRKYELTEDGRGVVYQAEGDRNGVFELYHRSLVDRSAAVTKVSGEVHGAGVVDFVVAGDRVVYRAELVDAAGALLSAPATGGGPAVRLDDQAPELSVHSFEVDTTGTWAVFFVYPGDGSGSLHSVRVDGTSAPVLLADSLFIPQNAFLVANRPGPRVFFRKLDPVLFHHELFRVPIDGSAPAVNLTPMLTGDQDLGSMVVTSDGRNVVFSVNRRGLYRVDTGDDTTLFELASSSSVGQSIGPLRISPDGATVAFGSHEQSFLDLYRVPIDGSDVPRRLSAPNGPSEYVVWDSFEFTPDGSHVVYLHAIGGVNRIYGVRADATMPPVRLNAALAPGESVFHGTSLALPSFEVSSDGQHVVFEVVQTGPPFGRSLFHARIDQASSAQQVFLFEGPEHRVVRHGDQELLVGGALLGDRRRLVGLPLAGGPVRPLSQPFHGAWDRLSVDPYGRGLFYEADVVEGALELFLSPANGLSTAPDPDRLVVR